MNIRSVIRPLLLAGAFVGGSVCMAQYNNSKQVSYEGNCGHDVFTSTTNQYTPPEKKVPFKTINWDEATTSEASGDSVRTTQHKNSKEVSYDRDCNHDVFTPTTNQYKVPENKVPFKTINWEEANEISTPIIFSTKAQTKAYTEKHSNKVAMQYMKKLQKDFGFTKAQAAGIVGNLYHESFGMNPGITQGGSIGKPNTNMADDNENGYGIAQWGGVRKEGLLKYAEKHKIPVSSDAANYGFLKQELKGKYKYVVEAIKDTDSAYYATQTFEELFEKASSPQMASRLAYADMLMDM